MTQQPPISKFHCGNCPNAQWTRGRDNWTNSGVLCDGKEVLPDGVATLKQKGCLSHPGARALLRPETTITEQGLEQLFGIISEVFDDLDAPMKIYCSVVEIRSLLWRKHRVDKIQFQQIIERLCAVDSPYRMKIQLAGGPTGAYKKNNFVEVEGRHWLYIQVETEQHAQFMEGHR